MPEEAVLQEKEGKPESTALVANVDNSWPFPKGRDWLLAYLAELVTYGLEFSITLNVHGITIGGTLISGETYLEESALALAHATTSGAVDASVVDLIAERFRGSKPLYQKPEGAPDDYRPPPPNYLHLRNPIYISSQGGSVTMNGALWRGRISSVDGFTFGLSTPRN